MSESVKVKKVQGEGTTDSPPIKTLQVIKFGGTSLKSIARIQHVAEIVAQRSKSGPVLVVVSAMGDNTDYLMKLARQCSSRPDQRELDMLLSSGEQISITLVAIMLHTLGVKARSFTAVQVGIFTENVHNNARIVDIRTEALKRSFQSNDVLVVAGFQGVTPNGDITTLGRGGSDITAVALAAATGTKTCDIYTDVDGILTADPDVVHNAKLLDLILYDEVIEMARMGAKVIHPRAIDLARQYGITLRVRNTFKPELSGTTIVGETDMEIYRNVSGVALDQDQASIAIVDVPDRPGVAGTVMTALSKRNILTDMIMQACNPTIGVNTITFTVNTSDLLQTLSVLEELKGQLGAKQVISDPDIAKVSLIGAGLAVQPDIAATLFTILGKNHINIKMISSGERKLTCVVSRHDAEKAARLIHEAFELDKKGARR
jgi:aspartate kinase